MGDVVGVVPPHPTVSSSGTASPSCWLDELCPGGRLGGGRQPMCMRPGLSKRRFLLPPSAASAPLASGRLTMLAGAGAQPRGRVTSLNCPGRRLPQHTWQPVLGSRGVPSQAGECQTKGQPTPTRPGGRGLGWAWGPQESQGRGGSLSLAPAHCAPWQQQQECPDRTLHQDWTRASLLAASPTISVGSGYHKHPSRVL